MKTSLALFVVLGLAGLGLAGCSSTDAGGTAGNFGGGGAVGTGASSGSGATGGSVNVGGTTSGGSGGSLNLGGGPATGGSTGSGCSSGPMEDKDQDGFTAQDGDCNDCDANANPGAYDVAGNNVDEDCNGTPDDTQAGCDSVVTVVEDNDPLNAARAIGLCQMATPGDKKWGVLEAKWVQPDGNPQVNPLSHGLLPDFGPAVNAQEGTRMLGLSSGTARRPSDLGYKSVGGYDTGIYGQAPPGFPVDSPSCSAQTANDKKTWNPAGFEVKIRVPTNAKSFKYNFDFYTYEWPGYVCTQYNDFFVALQSPAPPNAQSGNISFDSQGNPVSVNNGFLEVCNPQIGATNPGGKNFPCALGTGQLQGTGFESHAATGWLETQSPATAGSEMTLRFGIWDMGDPILDSTVLIDNFQFSADEATGTTTKPVPTPK